jgi:hypothetical protein
MAVTSMTKMRITPACLGYSVATTGGTDPSPASTEVMGICNAVEGQVAREKGIANQQILQKRVMRILPENLWSNLKHQHRK